tara:strand:+ start:48 stop:281 length:234 start_codon:yes stop_codon:yes gene_type:complete
MLRLAKFIQSFLIANEDEIMELDKIDKEFATGIFKDEKFHFHELDVKIYPDYHVIRNAKTFYKVITGAGGRKDKKYT